MNRWKFTLIELLVVVAIIGILMGILIPVLAGMRGRGQETQAKAGINSLCMALRLYEENYGTPPWMAGSDLALQGDKPNASGTASAPSENASYDKLIGVLTGVDFMSDGAMVSTLSNARRIKYLETPGSYLSGGYLDPWGRRYGIGLDLDFDGKVSLDGSIVNAPLGVFSFGRQGRVEIDANGTRSYPKVPGGDDGKRHLRSWQ